MSVNNETMQVKPDFKIESCEECPAKQVCNYFLRDNACKETRKKIEVLVNGKGVINISIAQR